LVGGREGLKVVDAGRGAIAMGAPKRASLGAHFASLTDPRRDYLVQHKLLDILMLTICGADDFVSVADYGRLKEKWLRRFLELPNGIPSHDTVGRVFGMLWPGEFERCFQNWIQAVFQQTKGQVVAIDGKTVRRSYDRWKGTGAIHLVSAWACANGVVLGQRKSDEKSHEITAIPELLRLLRCGRSLSNRDRSRITRSGGIGRSIRITAGSKNAAPGLRPHQRGLAGRGNGRS